MAEASKTLSHIPLPAISPKVVRFPHKFRTLSHLQPRQRKANSAMTDTSPTAVNRTLPTRLPSAAYRVREYLTEKEVDRLIEAARKRGRNGASLYVPGSSQLRATFPAAAIPPDSVGRQHLSDRMS